jgi:hypothetical protein
LGWHWPPALVMLLASAASIRQRVLDLVASDDVLRL